MFRGRGPGASTSLAIAALLLMAFPALAQQSAPVVVKVISEQATVAVQTSQSTPLTAVLEEFCRQTRTDCEGIDTAAKVELPPIDTRGTWEQVIARLMEGTDLNYAAMPATAASDARLLITGRALSPEAPQQASAADGTQRNEEPARSVSSDLFNPDEADATADTSPPQEEAPAEATAADVAPTQAGAAAAVPSETAPVGVATPPQPGPPAPGTATDFMGNPVPSYSGPAYSPFPDGNGNLIPAGNQPTTSSPFPDSNGNLAPVPKQPTPSSNPFPPRAPEQD